MPQTVEPIGEGRQKYPTDDVLAATPIADTWTDLEQQLAVQEQRDAQRTRGPAVSRLICQTDSACDDQPAAAPAVICATWYSEDPVQAKRISAAMRRYNARRELEAAHAEIGLRFHPPILTSLVTWDAETGVEREDTRTWLATWAGGQAAAASDAELYEIVRERLKDVAQ
jgi:hypothetical protein